MDENRLTRNFKNGEAEELVKNIRQQLRSAEQYKSSAPHIARQHQDAANKLIDILLEKLASRFQQYAWKCMGTKSQDDIDDAVREMTLRVLQRVQDTSNSAGALFFEKLFNKALLGCMNDAVDFARGEYLDFDTELLKERKRKKAEGKIKGADEFNADLFPLSYEAMDAQELNTLETAQADRTSLHLVESLFAEDGCRQFLQQLSPPNRRLLEGWWNQEPIKDIAQAIGVCEKTARNRLSVLHEQLALQILGPDKVAQAKKRGKSRA